METDLHTRNQQMSVPNLYWSKLSESDKEAYLRLRDFFHNYQRSSSKDKRVISFQNELIEVLKFIQRREDDSDLRAICTGVGFGAQFICVNTRQLKNFMGRCKSSINGSFQQLGYFAFKAKMKARQCILTILPNLQNDQLLMRQWTVRCAGADAAICFVCSIPSSKFSFISERDLAEEGYVSLSANTQIKPPEFSAPQRLVTFAPIEKTENTAEYSYYNGNDFYNQNVQLTDPGLSNNEWNYHILPRSQSGSLSEARTQFLGDFSLF